MHTTTVITQANSTFLRWDLVNLKDKTKIKTDRNASRRNNVSVILNMIWKIVIIK